MLTAINKITATIDVWGAVLGALLGALHGLEGWPARWLDGLLHPPPMVQLDYER